MFNKLIRNMSTPSRIPVITKQSNNLVDSNASSYSYMYNALINYKNKGTILKINNRKKSNYIENAVKMRQTEGK